MKDIFPEYFVNKKKVDFHNLDDSIIVILDTNVLLDLYRGSKKLRDELTKSLYIIKKNVWMPYQVGFEFNRNRKILMHSIAEDKKLFTKNLSNKLQNVISESTDTFKSKYILFKEIVDENDTEFKKLNQTIDESLKKIHESYDFKENDTQLPFIEDIFEGKVADNQGYDYSEWESEGLERFDIERPPGYKDYKEKKNEYYFIKGQRVSAAYGDFFLWKEILLKANDEKIKEVIFITKDVKEDWFFETKGKKIGARVELIDEMLRESSANFRMYTSSAFLSKTSAEKDYKLIEEEVINSEKSFLEDDFKEIFSQYTFDNNFQTDLKYSRAEDETFEYLVDVKTHYTNTYILFEKINVERNQIENKLKYIKLKNLTINKQVFLKGLENDYHNVLSKYKHLEDEIAKSIDVMKELSTLKKIQDIYYNLQYINFRLSSPQFE